jgi:simple sugar transport system permease protein
MNRQGLPTRVKWILGLGLGILAIILVGALVNKPVFFHQTTVLAIPFLLGTLGEIFAERSGVLNLGIEGILSTGAILGVIATMATGTPWAGVALAMVGGALMALLFAVIVINFQGMQVPAGLGLFMVGLGYTGLIGADYVGLLVEATCSNILMPGLVTRPGSGLLLFSHDLLAYISILLVPILWFVLYKTSIGLKLRSVGENPGAVDASGVNVYFTRYLATCFGGALAGLAGAYLTLAVTPSWTEGMSGGKGWIVIALTIFALWDPFKALIGSWLFGGLFALQFMIQGHGIPVRLINIIPYLATLVVLGFVLVFSEQLGAPSALLKSYERE